MQIEVLNAKDSRPITKCSVTGATTIAEVKANVAKANKKLTVHRQSIRQQQTGRSLKDEDTIEGLSLRDGGKLYVKDLGPQIGWKTVSESCPCCSYSKALAHHSKNRYCCVFCLSFIFLLVCCFDCVTSCCLIVLRFFLFIILLPGLFS